MIIMRKWAKFDRAMWKTRPFVPTGPIMTEEEAKIALKNRPRPYRDIYRKAPIV